MSRFAQPQDPVFQRLNASLGFDRRLWPHDVRQSRAHARMLAQAGIISGEDRDALLAALDEVEGELRDGRFAFLPDDEDIHMAVERRVTEIAGPPGGKLHTARSRNDQVATDVALFTRDAAGEAAAGMEALVRDAPRRRRAPRSTGRCPATRICSVRSPSTSPTTCSPTSGCSFATARGCASSPSRRPCFRSARERWQG